MDVKHLRDEILVLREEIDQMTQEIDGLSNGHGTVATVLLYLFFLNLMQSPNM